MKQLDDESLLTGLGAALSLDVTPSQQEIDDLRALVVSNDSYSVVVPILAPRRRARLSRIVTVAAAVVLGAVGIAALAGTSMPGSMRDPARAVGFAVQSQEMTEARSAVAGLRLALAHGNDAQVVVAADLLGARLRAVSADEARQLEPEASDLLRAADARVPPPVAPVATESTSTAAAEHDEASPTIATPIVEAPTPAATPVPSPTSGSEKESAKEDGAAKSEKDTHTED